MRSDANSAALVSDAGSMDQWPAMPFRVVRRYVPGARVPETTLFTSTGVVCLRDALALGPRERLHDLGLECPHEVLRHHKVRSGSVKMVLELASRPEDGSVRPERKAFGDGDRTSGGRARSWCALASLLRSQRQLDVSGELLNARFRLQEQLGEMTPAVRQIVASLTDAAAATGANRTRECGKCAASPARIPPPRRRAGQAWIARSASRHNCAPTGARSTGPTSGT